LSLISILQVWLTQPTTINICEPHSKLIIASKCQIKQLLICPLYSVTEYGTLQKVSYRCRWRPLSLNWGGDN
jgi:hypothetical protein